MLYYLRVGIAVLAVPILSPLMAQPSGAWRERTELFWDQASKQLVSRSIRVWDAHPDLKLDFYWQSKSTEPVPRKSEAGITGAGKLIWFDHGAPYYDPQAVRSVYVGTLKDGRADGLGWLKATDGLIYDGNWTDGAMSGRGSLHRPNGDTYDGGFADGAMSGFGVYTYATGDVLRGIFVEGRRQGSYILTTADGRVWRSTWAADREVSRVLALPLQMTAASNDGGSSDALPVFIDVKRNDKFTGFDMAPTYVYAAKPRGSEVVVSLYSPDVAGVWKNSPKKKDVADEGDTSHSDLVMDPKAYAPAFLRFDLPKERVANVKDVTLQVLHSQPFLNPQIQLSGGSDNCGRPIFSTNITIYNLGRGPVRSMRLTYSFVGADDADGNPSKIHTRTFNTSTEAFEEKSKLSLADSLLALKVKLPSPPIFKCSKNESEDDCFARLQHTPSLGDLAKLASDAGGAAVNVAGDLSYKWTDAAGLTHTSTKPLSLSVPLIEMRFPFPEGEGECGDLEAQRRPVHPAMLADAEDGYDVAVPRKAMQIYNDGISIAVAAWQASYHQFKIVVTMKDGTKRTSRLVDLYYFVPRKPTRPSRR